MIHNRNRKQRHDAKTLNDDLKKRLRQLTSLQHLSQPINLIFAASDIHSRPPFTLILPSILPPSAHTQRSDSNPSLLLTFARHPPKQSSINITRLELRLRDPSVSFPSSRKPSHLHHGPHKRPLSLGGTIRFRRRILHGSTSTLSTTYYTNFSLLYRHLHPPLLNPICTLHFRNPD